LLHEPQLLVSEFGSEQLPLQQFSPLPQAWSHEPQLFGSDVVSMQLPAELQ
jgi:hypothetical protein